MKFSALDTGEFAYDLKHTLPGKNAYLCFSEKCLKNAFYENKFKQTFGHDFYISSFNSIINKVVKSLERHIYALMRSGLGSNKLLNSAAMKRNSCYKEAYFCLLSEDVGENNKKDIVERCSRNNIDYIFFKTKNDYYNNIEGKNSAAFYVTDKLLADKLKETVNKVKELNNWVL